MFDLVKNLFGHSTTISFAPRNSGATWSITENGMMTGLSTNAVRALNRQSIKSVMMAFTMDIIKKLLNFKSTWNAMGKNFLLRSFNLTFRRS